METQCRVKINLHDGYIELEGSEAFVSKYLDEFKVQMKMPQVRDTNSDIPSVVELSHTSAKPESEKVTTHKQGPTKTKTKTITPEKFDIEKTESAESLKDYLNSKYQGTSAWERIMIVGYYITRMKQKDLFTEGNVEYAYRVLDLKKRPLHLRQAFIDIKNKKQWLEEDVDGKGWRLSRAGEIHVEEELVIKS